MQSCASDEAIFLPVQAGEGHDVGSAILHLMHGTAPANTPSRKRFTKALTQYCPGRVTYKGVDDILIRIDFFIFI